MTGKSRKRQGHASYGWCVIAIVNGYTDLTTLKMRLDVFDGADDAQCETMIEAASRMIDGWCGRVFYEQTAQTRYFTPEFYDLLILDDDLVSITTLKTDDDADRVYETTWAATDYDLDPQAGPYGRIAVAPNGRYGFPTHRRAVQIVGTFGYASVPHAIREACLLQTARLWKRRDAPFGIAGSAELGQMQTIAGLDPDVKQLLQPYKRYAALAVA